MVGRFRQNSDRHGHVSTEFCWIIVRFRQTFSGLKLGSDRIQVSQDTILLDGQFFTEHSWVRAEFSQAKEVLLGLGFYICSDLGRISMLKPSALD